MASESNNVALSSFFLLFRSCLQHGPFENLHRVFSLLLQLLHHSEARIRLQVLQCLLTLTATPEFHVQWEDIVSPYVLCAPLSGKLKDQEEKERRGREERMRSKDSASTLTVSGRSLSCIRSSSTCSGRTSSVLPSFVLLHQ